MKKSRRSRRVILCAGLALLAAASLALAAYYGKGNFKDVFVNRKNCFSSDTLSSVSRMEDAKNNVVRPQGSVEKIISFYNYDRATGEYNDFDLTFDVYAWLDKDTTGKIYTITYGASQTVDISGTDHSQPVFSATLKGGSAMEVSVRVNFNAGTEDDLTTFPNLLLAAVPTKPSYMASRMLGACIVPSRSEGFHVETYFERTAGEADIEDYAAFTYVISMMGEPPEGGTMRLMWKSAYLTLMEHNELAGQVQKIENSTDGFDRYIDIPQEANYYNTLTFMRVQGVEEAADPWYTASPALTWTDLDGCIQWQQLT